MTTHTMRPVTSSNIASVGYHYETQTLRVEFYNGTAFIYEGVPPEIDAQLREIEDTKGSIGRFFHYAIKGKFTTKKLGAEELAGAA